MKITNFLKDLLKDLAKDYIKWIVIFILGGGLIVFFKKIIALLNLEWCLPIYVFIVLAFIISFITYKLSKPRKPKLEPFFVDYGGLSWRTVVFSNPEEIYVEEVPYCIKCRVRYVCRDASFVYNRTSILECPICGGKQENLDISAMRSAVANIVEAQIKGFLNKPSL
jgi:hypothetical protein